MGVDQIDASNACIPPTHPLTHQSLPLPTATRGEPISLDGDGGRLNDSNNDNDTKTPLLMYAVGKLIVIREIDIDTNNNTNGKTTRAPSAIHTSPSNRPSTSGFLYRGHSSPVTALRFSPSGTFVASGDARGKLRIWSYDHEEHLPKIELQILAGPVRDICWDGDGKRLCVVGEGLQGTESGKVVMWDTGVKCGDLGQHARKKGSSCAICPVRPMRIATGGGEDSMVFFHKGPPFARVVGDGVVSEKCHERGAVHCLRYTKDGRWIASVGTDGSVCLYDGKSMALVRRVEKVHRSSIFSCAWNRSGTHLLTCGADGFARLMEGESGEVVMEWDVAKVHLEESDNNNTNNDKVPVGAMQLGCAFIKGNVPVSVGYNGQIAVLPLPSTLNLPFTSTATSLDKPMLITGHQAPISAMTFGAPGANTIYTADTDGVIIEWNGVTGKPKGRVTVVGEEDVDISGKVHSGATVTCLSYCNDGVSGAEGTLYSAGWDDYIRITNGRNCVDKLKMEAQPNAMTCGTYLTVIMTVEGLVLIKDKQVISELIRLPYTATAICLSKDDSMLYVGGNDCNIYVYSVESSTGNPLLESHVIKGGHLKPVQSLALSHDGTMLAAGDVRDVCIYSTTNAEYSTLVSKGRWCFHTQRIGCLAWSPDDRVVASGGNDDDIYLWCLEKKMKRVHYRFAHRGGVTGLRFVGDGDGTSGKGDWMLVSTGNDGCVNWWNVEEDVKNKFK